MALASPKEHGVVRLVEDRVVGASISNTHRALEDDRLFSFPHLDECMPAMALFATPRDAPLFTVSFAPITMATCEEIKFVFLLRVPNLDDTPSTRRQLEWRGSSLAPNEFTVSLAPMTG